MSAVIPILRSFDEAKMREFYVDFLEFKIDWEHRFDETAPLYVQASRGECTLHISEHFGDATPGTAVRLNINDIEAYNLALNQKAYKHAHPGLKTPPWGGLEMSIHDPFGNRLIFWSNQSA